MPAATTPAPAEHAGRGRVRDLFLRLLGAIFVAAFLSLYGQITVLVGEHGLLPAGSYLRHASGLLDAPTLFRLDAGDRALRLGALAGAVASLGLALGLAPRWCLAAIWILYLSLVTVGQDFLAFQWDNLLLESALLALFVAPAGLRPGRAPAPPAFGVLLLLWLVFRLSFESGAAKLLGGDPTWRDLTAMASYYETAPLPTWVGWYAHQLPLWAHRLTSVLVYVAELGVPFLIWGGPRLRVAAFAALVAMQVLILLTANYSIFNYLSIALALFVLDDSQLGRAAAWLGVRLAPAPPRPTVPRPIAALGAAAALVLVALSLLRFASLFSPLPPLGTVGRALDAVRSVNAYHLFAHMTLVRREVVIEGSADGVAWRPYEFRYKPGDPERRPTFVAPHQPRVDFQLWFLLLGQRWGSRYFDTLLARLLTDPRAVAPLFAVDPFPDAPPRFVRVAVYRYRFTGPGDADWWRRELEGYSRAVGAGALAEPSA